MRSANSAYLARLEWEKETYSYPKIRQSARGRIAEDPFRRYGDAIAWLEWDVHCTIVKIETIFPKNGHGTALLTFLKVLADKHGVLITGNPIAFKPAFSETGDRFLEQDQLEEWYSKNGFMILKRETGARFLWYPRSPI